MILLDTNVLIWLAGDDPRLGSKARATIEQVSIEDGLAASAMALWEIGLLATNGKLLIPGSLNSWIDKLIENLGIEIMPIDRNVAIAAGILPRDVHGDPGDRMMIATARERICPLMTSDRKILGYAKAGLLQAIDARR
ncbi:MAG: type II toxin-antitoxin system VapC family toxin [Pseudomonadota bacterium]